MDANAKILELIDSGRPHAVGLLLSADGSTPREAGVKAVIEADGRIWGTLGGGSVEAEAQRRAVDACVAGVPQVFEVALTGADAASTESICGGHVRILVDPTAAKDRAAYAEAVAAIEERRTGWLATTVEGADPTTTRVTWHSGPVAPHASGDAFIEPVTPAPRLVIVGGGHVGQALAKQAALLRFDIIVIDDRPEFADPGLFPDGVRTCCGDVAREMAGLGIARDTYVVIIARGHHLDADALEACIGSDAAYIGMMGSRRKIALMRRSFIENGLATEPEFDRVYAPIGLDIGAETVAEIATSIAAQLVSVRRTQASDRMPT